MANTHTTLTSLLTDIADAIREKAETTENIVADNFPDAIKAIKSGMSTVNSEVVQGYSLYEALEPGTFVTKADCTSNRLLDDYAEGSKAFMIRPDLGIVVWNTYESFSAPGSTSYKYTCYAKAFKVVKGVVQFGPQIAFITNSYNYGTILDAIPISDNKLLIAEVYSTTYSTGSYSIDCQGPISIRYLTVNDDLSLTFGTEVTIRTSYSSGHDAKFQKAPNGNIYLAYIKTGSKSNSFTSSTTYYIYFDICLLSLGESAPTVVTTTAIYTNTSTYATLSLGTFVIFNNTSAMIHYDTRSSGSSSEKGYALQISFSGNTITKGTSTTISASATILNNIYAQGVYSATQVLGVQNNGQYALLMEPTKRTRITLSENIVWVGKVENVLYCLTNAGKLCLCTISISASSATLSVGEVKADLKYQYYPYDSKAFIFEDGNLTLTPCGYDGNLSQIPFHFSEYLYRIGSTYKETTERGTIFGITAGELLTTTLGDITTNKEVN